MVEVEWVESKEEKLAVDEESESESEDRCFIGRNWGEREED